jgi:hypothetical protein
MYPSIPDHNRSSTNHIERIIAEGALGSSRGVCSGKKLCEFGAMNH